MSASTPLTDSTFSADGFFPPRLRHMGLVFAVPLFLALLIVTRLVQFQVFLHNNQNVDSFVERNLPDIPTRGVIADTNGDLLAGDVWTFRFVVPRLNDMPAHYREVVTHLLAGVTQTSPQALNAQLADELRALQEREEAERQRARATATDPQPVYAYVVLADDLHLAQGQYLQQLQQQGLSAASLWELYRTGDDNAHKQLQKLLAPETGTEPAASSSLKQVMDRLGLRTDLEAPDFDFFRHFRLEKQPVRYYTQGALGSHVLGLVNAEREGINGIEGYYQKFLRGDVSRLHMAEPLSVLTPEARRYVPSHMGGDLVLTIDRTIQYIVEQELHSAIAQFNVQAGGSVIVMEPRTGAILAMANQPSFNPGALDELGADTTSFTNLTVTGVYEPGSVFKVLTVAIGLDLEVLAPEDEFFDIGTYDIGPQVTIQNSEERVGGKVTATEALAQSLNTIMAEIAIEHIGAAPFYDYLFQFGLGEVTGIDLAHEFNGSLKDKYPGTANWHIADLGVNSFGQGLNLTPIQMINAINVISNGGNLMKPYVVRHRVNTGDLTTFSPTILRRDVVRPDTARTVTEMMVFTVEETVYKAQVPGYQVAGKSGTAQVPDPERIGAYSEDLVVASFAGFAPAADPRIAVLIKLNHPASQDGTPVWGSENAAPTFSRIVQRILDYLNVPPACHPACYATQSLDPAQKPVPLIPVPGQAPHEVNA